MKLFLSFSFLIAVLSFALPSQAQVGLEGLSSGRYEIHKKTSRRPASETAPAPKVVVPPVTEKEVAKKELEPTLSPVVVVEKKPEETELIEPSIGEQAESLIFSKAEKIYEFYRAQLESDDIRNNRVELEILSMVASNESKSNYAFREYQSFFNALQVKSNVWFTPLIGISGKIMFSLGADLDSLEADKSRVPAKYESVDLGLNFRRFFGVNHKASSVEFSLLYGDSKMTVPTDSTSRPRLKSLGFGMSLKARLPSSGSYAWTFGGSLFPRLTHTETATGVAMQSGSPEESIRAGLDLGGEWKFTRESQMIWGLGVTAERNMFSGAVTLSDPVTGSNPSNVSVTNTLYMFSLGYRWGH